MPGLLGKGSDKHIAELRLGFKLTQSRSHTSALRVVLSSSREVREINPYREDLVSILSNSRMNVMTH